MDELIKAIHANDLRGFIRSMQTILGEDLKQTSDTTTAQNDTAMLNAILANREMPQSTRALIAGIAGFLEARSYITDRQRDTVLTMYKQWGKQQDS